MDDIGLYKGKLNEALNIVPTMSDEKKWEAVTYWNNVAVEFQKIVAIPGANSSASKDNPMIEVESAVNGESDSALPISEVEISDILNSQSCIVGHQLSAMPIVSNSGCASALVEHTASDRSIVESAEVLITTPAATSPVAMPDLKSTTTTTMSKQLDIPLEATIEYDNVIPSETLGCPRTAADVADEIGNGQFDRGPTKSNSGAIISTVADDYIIAPSSTTAAPIVHHSCQREQHLHHDHNTISNETILTTDGNCSSQAIMISNYHRHIDTYTHSERPLQQIQPFDISSNHHHHEVFFPNNQSSNQNRGGMVSNSNQINSNYLFNQQQTHLSYITSSDNNLTAFPNMFSPSVTPSLMENMTMIDIERQIFDIKRELIVDIEPRDAVSNENIGSIGSNGSTNTNSSQQQHTCDVCGKSGFSTKGNLKRHLKAHSGEKPFKCDFCNSCFTEKKSLKIHVRRHTGEKPYKCNVCDKLFSQTGVLQSHMALHLNERKFECQKCGKAFRQRSQLKLHLMRHDGVKRLECQTCNAKFLTKGDLERHCRIHTGEKPYRCEMCNKTFTRQQSLNEHLNRHTGKRPYYCKYCDKTFSEMSACYKHAKTHKRQEQIQHQPIVLH